MALAMETPTPNLEKLFDAYGYVITKCNWYPKWPIAGFNLEPKNLPVSVTKLIIEKFLQGNFKESGDGFFIQINKEDDHLVYNINFTTRYCPHCKREKDYLLSFK